MIAQALSPLSPPRAGAAPPPDAGLRDAGLRDAAERLEASFLKEMLTAAGLGRAPGPFGGGAGEEHFGSFLLDAQSLAMARAGGVGLAEAFVRAMARDD